MAFGYRYRLERQQNGWWLVRFPGIPEALTEGETEEEARINIREAIAAHLESRLATGEPICTEICSEAISLAL